MRLASPTSAVLSAFLAAACSSGGSSSSSAESALAPADVVGTWNFFREADACSGDEFAFFPMIVREDGDGTLTVSIGEPGETFDFEATLSGRALTLSGEPTVGDTTLLVVEQKLILEPDGDSMSGAMAVQRIDDVICSFLDRVSAFRVDATDSSPVVGPWTWTATTTAATGDCGNEVGTVEVLDVDVLPRRENEFTVDVRPPGGGGLQFVGRLDGSSLVLSGSDTFIVDTLENESATSSILSSALVFDASASTIEGEIRVANDEAGTCTQTLRISGVPFEEAAPPTQSFLPYLEDFTGSQIVVGVDPVFPTSSTPTLDFGLGLPIANAPGLLPSFTGVSLTGAYDPATRELSDRRPASLFYRKGDDLFALDLTRAPNGSGGVALPEPRLVAEDLEDARDLQVFSFVAGPPAVLAYTTASGPHLTEVAADGSAKSAAGLGAAIGAPVDPSDGAYRGILTLDGGGNLRLEKVGGGQLIDSGVQQALPAGDGSIYYAAGGELRVLRPGGAGPLTLTTFVSFLAPVVDGVDLFFADATFDNPSTVTFRRAGPDGVQDLAVETDGKNDFGGLELLEPRIVLTPERLVYQYRAFLPTTRSVTRAGADKITIDDEFPVSLDLSKATAVGETIFLDHVNDGSALSFRSDGSEETVHPGSSWVTPIPGRSFTLGARTEAVGMLLESGGALRVFDTAEPTVVARELGTIPNLSGFTPAPLMGSTLLLSTQGDVVFVDTQKAGSAVRLSPVATGVIDIFGQDVVLF